MHQANRSDGVDDRRQLDSGFESEATGVSTVEALKDTVAGKLQAAATAIQKSVGQNQNPKLAKYGEQAANWLDGAADYVRDADPQKFKTELQSRVRQNPGRSLLVAGAAGLLLGVLLRRR
jgi:ElaB/YqjD/DUF883 family membrane-anchored ribosome-binding protein